VKSGVSVAVGRSVLAGVVALAEVRVDVSVICTTVGFTTAGVLPMKKAAIQITPTKSKTANRQIASNFHLVRMILISMSVSGRVAKA